MIEQKISQTGKTADATSPLKGFLWGMGRSGVKAVLEIINSGSDQTLFDWNTSLSIMQSPEFFEPFCRKPHSLLMHMPRSIETYKTVLARHPELPLVHLVRDPLANFKSHATATFISYAANRTDEVAKGFASGGADFVNNLANYVLGYANSATCCHEHSQLFGSRPVFLIDTRELSPDNIQASAAGICGHLGGLAKPDFKPVEQSNIGIDRYLNTRKLPFRFNDRTITLHVTRWGEVGRDPGYAKVTTIPSEKMANSAFKADSLDVYVPMTELLPMPHMPRDLALLERNFEEQETVDHLVRELEQGYNTTLELTARFEKLAKNAMIEVYLKAHSTAIGQFAERNPKLLDLWDMEPYGRFRT